MVAKCSYCKKDYYCIRLPEEGEISACAACWSGPAQPRAMGSDEWMREIWGLEIEKERKELAAYMSSRAVKVICWRCGDKYHRVEKPQSTDYWCNACNIKGLEEGKVQIAARVKGEGKIMTVCHFCHEGYCPQTEVQFGEVPTCLTCKAVKKGEGMIVPNIVKLSPGVNTIFADCDGERLEIGDKVHIIESVIGSFPGATIGCRNATLTAYCPTERRFELNFFGVTMVAYGEHIRKGHVAETPAGVLDFVNCLLKVGDNIGVMPDFLNEYSGVDSKNSRFIISKVYPTEGVLDIYRGWAMKQYLFNVPGKHVIKCPSN